MALNYLVFQKFDLSTDQYFDNKKIYFKRKIFIYFLNINLNSIFGKISNPLNSYDK